MFKYLKRNRPAKAERFLFNPVHNPRGKTRENAGKTRHLRRSTATSPKQRNQRILGETPKAVKPCPEDYEQEQITMVEC